jgi:hypothetical protein
MRATVAVALLLGCSSASSACPAHAITGAWQLPVVH